MTGIELYTLWVRGNDELLNCGVEEWANLEEGDQQVWNWMATQLREAQP